jgi:hypothetical protein
MKLLFYIIYINLRTPSLWSRPPVLIAATLDLRQIVDLPEIFENTLSKLVNEYAKRLIEASQGLGRRDSRGYRSGRRAAKAMVQFGYCLITGF